MRHPRARRDLAEFRPNLRGDLRLHQLPRDQRDRLAHEILKPAITHLRNDIGNRHALTIGHRGVSNRLTAKNSRRVRRHGGRPSPAVDLPDARYTTSTDMTVAEQSSRAGAVSGIGVPRRRSALGSHCFNGRVGAADPRPDQRWRPLGRGAIIQAEASLVAKAIARSGGP